MQTIGIGLLIVAAILLIVGAIRRRQGNHVSSNRGSVAVGGDNLGSISVTTQGTDGEKVSVMTIWNIVAGVASVLGLALTLWPTGK